jgi:hypothetical protein
MATSKRKPASSTPARPKPRAGPVTLEEARALIAKPKLDQRNASKAKAAPPSGSLLAIGIEREKLRQQRSQDLAEHVREYKATMTILKKRGVRPLQPKQGAAKLQSKAKGFVPLQILAEGDSWFKYPGFLQGGIISRLERRIGVPILNLAKAGDEVRYMLGVEERKLLIKHLRKGCPAGGSWDVLLFSGGGNDIVDKPLTLWIMDFDPARPPATLLHPVRFKLALELVRAGYEDLIGPWLKPSFDLRGFPPQAAREIVKVMLQQFAAMLTSLATAPNVTFINGQGTLEPVKESWHNELHPSRAGFDQFADLFHAKLGELFPNRVQ